MANPDIDAVDAVLRTDLGAVIRKCFETVTGGAEYLHNWHIGALCKQLQDCMEGRKTRLMVSMPPRNLKSIAATVALPVMALGLETRDLMIGNALSGGTREQIAILTRLAFAKLLAKTGNAPPVILDDVLIFSDDDQIEKMFTALHA